MDLPSTKSQITKQASEQLSCGLQETYDLLWHDRRTNGSMQLTPFGMNLLQKLELDIAGISLGGFIPNASFRMILSRKTKGPWHIASDTLYLFHPEDITEIALYSGNFPAFITAYRDIA